MRIGVNTRFLLKDKMEGFGWYTYETMLRITQSHPEHEFIFFFDRPYDEKFIFSENITPVVLFPPARHPFLQIIWFDYALPPALKKHKCDVFVSTDGYLSLKTDMPQLTVMHDLNFEHNPTDLPKGALKFLQKRFPLFAKKADQLCTVSEFSKNDIVQTYGIAPQKIHVTYNGASPAFRVIDEKEKIKSRLLFTSGKEYVLFVGAIHKRKNLKRLITAYKSLKHDGKIEQDLLIVGAPMWKSQEVEIDEKLKPYVHFTGHVSLATLTKIMASADALAFVSYFEGFGIPLVEAMQSGVPVLAGNLTALPEIGGDAVLYCDPFSTNSIEEQLEKILTNEPLCKELIEKGLKRAQDFSWDYTAEALWKAIEKLFSNQFH